MAQRTVACRRCESWTGLAVRAGHVARLGPATRRPRPPAGSTLPPTARPALPAPSRTPHCPVMRQNAGHAAPPDAGALRGCATSPRLLRGRRPLLRIVEDDAHGVAPPGAHAA